MRPDEGSRSRGTQGRTCRYPEWFSSRNSPPHTGKGMPRGNWGGKPQKGSHWVGCWVRPILPTREKPWWGMGGGQSKSVMNCNTPTGREMKPQHRKGSSSLKPKWLMMGETKVQGEKILTLMRKVWFPRAELCGHIFSEPQSSGPKHRVKNMRILAQDE